MSKFLSIFIQKTSGFLQVRHTIEILAMSKRSGFPKAPKFKPEVKAVGRVKETVTMSQRTERVSVLPEPIKSEADKKLYKLV